MVKLKVNGVLVNALENSGQKIAIDFNEAYRLLCTIKNLNFSIVSKESNMELKATNIEKFRSYKQTTFLIKDKITTDTKSFSDIKDLIEDAGFACIESIKYKLEMLAWFGKYDERGLQRFNIKKLGNVSIEDIFLDEDRVMVIYYQFHGRSISLLSALFIEESISVEDLLAILEALDEINTLEVTAV